MWLNGDGFKLDWSKWMMKKIIITLNRYPISVFPNDLDDHNVDANKSH